MLRSVSCDLKRTVIENYTLVHLAEAEISDSRAVERKPSSKASLNVIGPREPVFDGCTPLIEGRDFRIEGGCVFLARGLQGEFTVRYIHRPRRITPDTLEEAVDLPPYAESLLPPLCASYLWLDDRGELATHYLALYRTEAEELASTLNRHGGAALSFRNGWDRG